MSKRCCGKNLACCLSANSDDKEDFLVSYQKLQEEEEAREKREEREMEIRRERQQQDRERELELQRRYLASLEEWDKKKK